MRQIMLYGELGEKFGKTHTFDVKSVGEAINALVANFKEFKKHLVESDSRLSGYEVWDGDYNLDATEDDFAKKGCGNIRIVPIITGASAVGRIVAGVVLMVLAVVSAGWSIPATGTLAGAVFGFGASMVLGGVVGLMTQNSSGTSTSSDSKNSQSYIFSGPANTTRQGNPVFVGYGEMVVGSQVISQSLITDNI